MRLRPIIVLSFLLIGCTETADQKNKWRPITIDSTITKDQAVEELISPYRELIDEEMNRILVKSDTIIYKLSPESPLGNLIADLSFERVVRESTLNGFSTPDLCLLNFGGLRVNLPQGDIQIRKVFELMPFENELVLMELIPDSLISLISYLSKFGGQPISNMELNFNSSENRHSALIKGNPVDSTRNYHVVTTDYLANGGDHMYFFKNPVNRIDVGIKLRDAIIAHFEEAGKAGISLNPKIDGRLIIKE